MNLDVRADLAEHIRRNAGWLIFLGVSLMLLGLLSIAAPLVTGIAIAYVVGFFILCSGITRILFAFRAHQWGLGILAFVLGALGIVAGLLTIAHPALGLSFLTLLLAAYLCVTGITESMLAFRLRPHRGWGWALASGLAALVLGAMIWGQWPVSGSWAIGLLVGINILFTGSSLMGLGMAARQVRGPEAA
jgi:uncharacterized membrane protein HdeD (DUF308 family)